jgi:hypothetical protein
MRTQTTFQKANERSLAVFGDKDHEGQFPCRLAREDQL